MKNQKGFTLVEGLLIALVLSVIGFAGYTVWNNNQVNGVATTSNFESTEQATEQKEEATQGKEESDIPEGMTVYPNEALGFSFA